MPITRDELHAWAQRGDPIQAWYTFQVVKDALQHESLRNLQYDIYPQGSYANQTNIADGSDVDIVIALQSAFYSDTGDLTAPEVTAYRDYYGPSELTWQRFRQMVIPILGKSFIAEPRSKCVKVSSGLIRLPADVLICLDFRHYREFTDLSHQLYDQGVKFYKDDRAIVNHPKQHLAKCGEKDDVTFGMYKKIVRVSKNARNQLLAADRSPISHETAPSYFIECLLWNVPGSCYSSDIEQAYRGVVGWLTSNRDNLAGLPCPNGMTTLFGSGPDSSWSQHKARSLIDAMNDQLHGG